MIDRDDVTIKDSSEGEEFFRPVHGMELAPYLALDDTQAIHHLARYLWVKDVLKGLQIRSVLDVACGAGYGSFMLAEHLPGAEIVGADYDERAVEEANRTYQRPNLRFTRGDIVAWKDAQGEPLGRFDAVVSFDTLEHIAHRDIALLRIAENLTRGGVLALSTPCTHEENLLSPPWKPHKIEYSHRDLKALLRRFFFAVLSDDEGTLPNAEFWATAVNKDHLRYATLANPLLCLGPIHLMPRNP